MSQLNLPVKRNLIHVAARIFNTPLLIEPTKLQAILHAIGDRLDIAVEEPTDAQMMAPQAFHPGFTDEDFESGRFPRGRYVVRDGVAVLEITGTLVHKGAWLGSYSGMTSYDGIGRQLDMIAADADVRALLLNVHSYGGEVAGCFDLVDQIYQMRGSMPITALVSDAAASAAYAIASAADETVVTQAGMAGSIGVVLTHFDLSRQAEQRGIAVTHIFAGKEKVLGSPFKSLSAADRRKLQTEVDDLYELFLAKVARNRDADVDLFRDTEAAVYYAQKAVDAGLADRVGAPRETLAALIAKVSPGLSRRMTTDDEGDDLFSDAAAAANTKEHVAMTDKATAAAEERKAATEQQLALAREDGKAEGIKSGTAAERERISKILTAEEAKGRSTLAHHLAFSTEMTAEAAVALLGKSAPESSGTPLRTAMAAHGTPGITSPEAPDGEAAVVRIDSASIYEARRQAARG